MKELFTCTEGGGKTLYNVKCSINKQQLKSAEKKWKKLEGE